MARRRKSRKMVTRRKRSGSSRRYVGAVSVNEVLGLVGGAVASRFVVNYLAKQFPKLGTTPTTKAAVQIGLGFVTKPIANAIGSKSPMLDAFGKGMIIAGGYELVKQVAPTAMGATDDAGDVIVVSGMDEIGANDISELNGMDDIGNADEISEINGYDED